MSKIVATKDWAKCPVCGITTSSAGNPIFCQCGAVIVRYIG